MIQIKINTKPLRDILQRFDDLKESEILQSGANDFLKWITQNFRDQGTETKWKPPSPNTLAKRVGGGVGGKALQNKGRLFQSFIGERGILSRTANSITVGSNVFYASFHERGTAAFTIRPKTKKALRFMTPNGPRFAKFVNHPGIPRRPILPTLATADKIVAREAEAIIEDVIAGQRRLG
jgi:phage gpG-like protein